MLYKGPRFFPFLSIVIPLVTTLGLRKDKDGNPLIAVSVEGITIECARVV